MAGEIGPTPRYAATMFTGLVQRVGRIESIAPTAVGASLWVSLERWAHRPDAGASISVDGCCLTVADRREASGAVEAVRFDAVHHTLAVTTLGDRRAGDRVNLEPAATPATLLGGHLVQGHVDLVVEVRSVDTEGGQWRVRCGIPRERAAWFCERGSVALDGVSLTIAAVGGDWFEVVLIPETLARTTLGERVAGDRLNLEADCIAKMVLRALELRGLGG
jgi:riboflavin synthase